MTRAGEGAVVVAGAGPHALTACAYLAQADATLLDRLVVVDPEGWLVRWHHKLDALGIEWLRSSCVHHPHPDPFALVGADTQPEDVRGPYRNPSRDLFARFCESLVDSLGLRERLVRERVVGLEPLHDCVRVQLSGGGVLNAARVVMATNPRRDHVPAFAAGGGAAIAHASDVDLRTADVAGRRVAVVGAGLTAVQLAVGAAARGAQATLFTRRSLHVRTFDVTAGWMTYKLAALTGVADPATRRRAVRAARGRGTTPQDDVALLVAGVRQGHVRVCERTAIDSLSTSADGITLHTTSGRVAFDHLWLATGSRPDLHAEPALRSLQAARPAAMAGDLPVLDVHCHWPGTAVHLMGELSALQTGPIAPNLAGARIAAERIAAAAGRPPRQYPVPTGLWPVVAER
ncbi:MAG TPA: FAD-dependent oxidoreductase [Candidatus Angelobacter sp.]|nr:FAD-dependent oxidoreductase [Candidatus Angelobacter sp.]